MARINENYQKLQAGYLFPEIGRRVSAFAEKNPDASIIRLGIGDVTLPLAPAVVEALHAAVDEMGSEAGFHGYGPENGYDFLTEAIADTDYRARGVDIAPGDIFVSDGSKQDSGNIQEIFGTDCTISVTDPSYPVYVDTNVMAGRTGEADDTGPLRGASSTCRRPRRTASCPVRRASGSTSPTCARPTTRPARSPRGRTSRRGSRGRRSNDAVTDLRRRLRRLHPGSGSCRARSTRSTGPSDVRDRDAQLLEASRLHRRPLRLHGRCPKALHGIHRQRRARAA